MTKPRVDPRARTKLDEETLRELEALISSGMPKAHACARVGVSKQALYQLAERDPAVAERLERASEAGAEWYREQVMHAEGQDWKRWAWLGERLHPRVFGPAPQRVEQSGPDGGAQRHEHSVTITRDEAISIARRKGE